MEGDALVCVCMMVIVLDAPWLEGIYERREHECPDYVFYKLIFAE
jgi:hypothetical protein